MELAFKVPTDTMLTVPHPMLFNQLLKLDRGSKLTLSSWFGMLIPLYNLLTSKTKMAAYKGT
jgi:hypothetical protein